MFRKQFLSFMSIFILVLLLTTSCGSTRNMDENALYNTEWVMEYIERGGTDLSLLFKLEMPHLTFDKEDQRVFGSSGCNGYNAGFTIENSSLSFGNPGPTTMMYCGKGEEMFRKALRRTNKYSIQDGKLYFYEGEIPLIRFKKRQE